MKIGIFSIPHSGTRFAKKLIVGIAQHLSEQSYRNYPDDFDVVIMPFRKPETVLASWLNRDKYRIHLVACYQMLLEFWSNNYLPLPVDHPDREKYLGRISEAVGLELKTDWEPIGHSAGNNTSMPIPEAYEIPIIRELYGNV